MPQTKKEEIKEEKKDEAAKDDAVVEETKDETSEDVESDETIDSKDDEEKKDEAAKDDADNKTTKSNSKQLKSEVLNSVVILYRDEACTLPIDRITGSVTILKSSKHSKKVETVIPGFGKTTGYIKK